MAAHREHLAAVQAGVVAWLLLLVAVDAHHVLLHVGTRRDRLQPE